MRVVAIIQARLTSTRLPRKILERLGDFSALELLIERIKKVPSIDEFIFAIPDTKENDELADFLITHLNYPVVRGSEDDVLTRYLKAAKEYPSHFYLRLTADCPLLCPNILIDLISRAKSGDLDYIANTNPPTFPDGFDAEVISARALEWSDKHVKDLNWREHVTFGFRQELKKSSSASPWKYGNLVNPRGNKSHIRVTLDDPSDLVVIREIVSYFGSRIVEVDDHEIESCYEKLNLQAVNGATLRDAAVKKLLSTN